MPFIVPANQPQQIRSSQKDEYYQTSIRNNANEAFQTLAGELFMVSVWVILLQVPNPGPWEPVQWSVFHAWTTNYQMYLFFFLSGCVRAEKTLQFSKTRFWNLWSSSLCIFPCRIKTMAAVEERSRSTVRFCLLCTNHSLRYNHYY